MESAKFKINNFITVPGFAVVELKLSGNELLCFSLIYGFTQDNETEFKGSLSYVASALNVTRQNAKKIIDRLIERGLIEKREIYMSGFKLCHYVTIAQKSNGVAEIATGGYQKNNGDVAETVMHNDIYIYNDKIIDNKAASDVLSSDPKFKTIVVTRPRRTVEPLCLFENSRYSDYKEFAAQFDSPEFADVDILYYFHAVADWSSQKGKKMKDWIATTRNFIRGDKEKGKLHRLPGAVLSPDALDYLRSMSD